MEQVSSIVLPPFRLIGKDCSLVVRNVVADTTLQLQGFSYDIARLPDSNEISARMSGYLGGDDRDRETKVHLRFASTEDFDLRVEADGVSAEDVNIFLPASRSIVEAGTITPTLRIAGYPGQTLTLSLDADYSGLTFREQPEFIDPFAGKLTALGHYNFQSHVFALATAKARAQDFDANLDGSVDFSTTRPVLDLHLHAARTPIAGLLGALLPEALSEYGTLNVEMASPAQVYVDLAGDTENPRIGAKGVMGNFKASFGDGAGSEMTLNIRSGEVQWDSVERMPSAQVEVVGGSLRSKIIEANLTEIEGVVRIKDGEVVMDPVIARLNDANCRGSIRYVLEKHVFSGALEGRLPFSDRRVGSVVLNGDVNYSVQLETSHDRTTIRGDLDATQCMIERKPFFVKHTGVGLHMKEIHAEREPSEDWKVQSIVEIQGAQVKTSMMFEREGEEWRMTDGTLAFRKLTRAKLAVFAHYPIQSLATH